MCLHTNSIMNWVPKLISSYLFVPLFVWSILVSSETNSRVNSKSNTKFDSKLNSLSSHVCLCVSCANEECLSRISSNIIINRAVEYAILGSHLYGHRHRDRRWWRAAEFTKVAAIEWLYRAHVWLAVDHVHLLLNPFNRLASARAWAWTWTWNLRSCLVAGLSWWRKIHFLWHIWQWVGQATLLVIIVVERAAITKFALACFLPKFTRDCSEIWMHCANRSLAEIFR